MTTMVASTNMGLQFRGNFCIAKKKIVDNAGKFLQLSLNSSSNTNSLNNKRKFSLVIASSNCSPQGMEPINVSLAPLTAGKLANESASDTALIAFMRGSFVEDRFVYRQIFVVRSYDIGPDITVTMETFMNFLQETALNHASSCGASKNDFGATHEMELRKLMWVVTRIQVQVQRYSKWGDEIEVDTWFDAIGKNGMRKDWIVRDHCTKEIIAKATSTWAIVNRETRRLCKLPEEVRQEIVSFHINRFALAWEEIDHNKIHKLTDDTAERFRSGMSVSRVHNFLVQPGWNDMDVNKHVNNVKYIRWVLESMPREVLEDYYMTSMTLEFRRECTQSNLLESMTSPSSNMIGSSNNDTVNRKAQQQYIHLLRLQDSKEELVRARTEWHLKQKHK